MILHPSPVISNLFTVTHEDAKTLLVAEMSDLPGRGALGRVYDDACDVGLTVISACTGREVVFVVERERRDREGELLWLDLVPANPAERDLNTVVRLYND